MSINASIDYANAGSKPGHRIGTPIDPGDNGTPATAAAVSVTLPAVPGQQYEINGVDFGYSGTGAIAGGIQISDGGNLNYGPIPVGAGGFYYPRFIPPLISGPGNAVVITLNSGGTGDLGNLYVHARIIK